MTDQTFIESIEGDGASAELKAALEVLAGLSVRVMADKKAAFAPDVIEALRLTKEQSRGDYASALDRLTACGVRLAEVKSAVTQAENQKKRGLRLVQQGEQSQDRLVCDFLKNSPMPDLIVPGDYKLELEQTLLTGILTAERVSHAAILVTGKARDVEGDNESIRLSWSRGNGWRHRLVDRATVANARLLTDLAAFGYPVTSNQAKAQVDYISDLEAANFESLPSARTVNHLGWQSGNESSFLIGKELSKAYEGEAVVKTVANPHSMDWVNGDVIFRPNAPGDDQIVSGYKAEGNLEKWIEAVESIQNYPRIMAALYASFAAPLLAILDCPNFVVDLCSITSQGKTTTQRLAASVWGVPDERSPSAAITTWETTFVGVERLSAVICDLPLILDDTKRARRPEDIAKVLYMVTSGRGKTRGSLRGLQLTPVYRTVLITSGEQPATSFTNDGGTRMRVLPIEGQPFERADIATGKIVENLNLTIRQNYGLAGRTFIQRLIENKAHWPEIRAEYSRRVEAYINNASNEKAGRLAAYAAAIAQAGTLAHSYLDLPFSFDDPIAKMWNSISGEADDPLGSKKAMRFVLSWANQNEHRFDGRLDRNRDGGDLTPSTGIVGKWDDGEDFESIAILPHVLETLLKEQKYHPEAIFREWADRGWLETKNEGQNGEIRRFTKVVHIRESRMAQRRAVRMNVITRQAFDESES